MFLRIFCLYLIGRAWGSESSPCYIIVSNTLICRKVELSRELAVHVDSQIHSVLLDKVNGSIGVKTLSPLQEAEELEILISEVSDIEKGALCSMPKLKTLKFFDDNFPILTKKHLSGCGNIKNFECDVPLEDDALEEMTGLKTLTLRELSRSDRRFKKGLLAPLIHLEKLMSDLDEWELEPGLFCTQPTLKTLRLHSRSPVNITESLFEGCNNLKKIYLLGSPGCLQVPEGQYPFSNMLHLETLYTDRVTDHLTKHFLNGLPELKEFNFIGNSPQKLNIDRDAFEGALNINSLSITAVSLEDSDLESLHVLSNLNGLDLRYNNIQDLNSLPALPKLEYITADFNKINKFDFSAFKEKFPSLKQLMMMSNQLDPAFEEELSNENKIMIHTDNDNKSFWDFIEN